MFNTVSAPFIPVQKRSSDCAAFPSSLETARSMTNTDQGSPGESSDPLLMPLVKSTSISVDEGEETGVSLETTETWVVYVCHSVGKWARQKI